MAARAVSTRLVLTTFYDILLRLKLKATSSDVREAERQIDVLLTATGSVHNLEYEPTELKKCINSLIVLVDQDHSNVTLLEKMLKLLENFASDELLKNYMIFHCQLLAKLCNNFRQWKNRSHTDTTLIQALNLLCKLTDGVVLKCPDGILEEIVEYTISVVRAGSCDEVTVLCMESLANMCRYSVSVKAYIKDRSSIKAIQKSLISYLSQGQLAIIVTSIHVLASLCLYDDLGESLFNSKNVDQTFQVAFNVLLKSPTYRPKARAVDLLVDIVQCERIQKSLYQYHSLSQFIEIIVASLPSVDGHTYSKLMELFVAFMQVKGIRGSLCKLFLKLNEATGQPAQLSQPFNSAIEWMSSKNQQYSKTIITVLDFLTELFTEVVHAGFNNACAPLAETLIQHLVKHRLHPPNYKRKDRHIRFSTLRALKTLHICLVLSNSTSYIGLLGHNLKGQFLATLIQGQLVHNPIVIEEEQCDWAMTGLEVFLQATVLAIKLSTLSSDINEVVQNTVTDSRVMKLLAKALNIQDKGYIQASLLIIKVGCTHADFQLQSLADSIAAMNHERAEVHPVPKEDSVISHTSSTSSGQFPSQMSTATSQHSAVHLSGVDVSHKPIPVDTSEVDALIDRFKSGVELRDAKSSEIMQVYEYKLQAMYTKESHLQDLLEAKALALSQADRLIAQYRGRRAQADAECLKLRNMLQESEKKCEEQKERLAEVTASSDSNVEKLKALDEQNKVLKRIVEEKERLDVVMEEQTAELEQCRGSLAAQTEENKKLLDINQKLRKQTSTIKLQHDHAISELENLEKEKQQLMQIVADKEKQILELQSSVNKFNQQYNQQVQRNTKLGEEMEVLNNQLSSAQATNSQLTEEVAQLEQSCQSLEQQLLRSNQIIQHQKTVLEQHTMMVTKIHELTSNPSRTSLEDADT